MAIAIGIFVSIHSEQKGYFNYIEVLTFSAPIKTENENRKILTWKIEFINNLGVW